VSILSRFRPGSGIHALAGAYALDALDTAERDRFERHLTGCASCTEQVRGFSATAAALAMAVAVKPPPGLKGRVLAEIGALDRAGNVDELIAGVLAAQDARVTSAATSAGGTATIVASLGSGAVVFTSSGMPLLPPSRVYELWFIGSGGARAAGLLPPARGQTTEPVFATGLRAGDSVGVTVEPAGGSGSPTTQPIVVMAVAA
jgi:anti-sigma-K factor RskA